MNAINVLILLYFSCHVNGFRWGARSFDKSFAKDAKFVLHNTPLSDNPAVSTFAKDNANAMIDCLIDSRKVVLPSGKGVKAIGMPRVIGGDQENDWKMWFQYRDDVIANEVTQLSTGSIAMSTSPDGISAWTVHPQSPVLQPSKVGGDWYYFDSEHVGLGDVIQSGSASQARFNTASNVYLMYTFGGNADAIELGEGRKMIGAKMEIGVAVSMNGINWSRVEGPAAHASIVEIGDKATKAFDSVFVGWPSVLEVGSSYRMYYHTFDATAKRFVVATATSKDGLRWVKDGAVFDGSHDDPTAFDAKGVSRRHVIRMPDQTYRMYYEGFSNERKHSIGLATSKDGLKWERHSNLPLLQASEDPNAWDAGGVSSPHVVYLADRKRWRMYYVGHPSGTEIEKLTWNGIGVAESIDEEGYVFKRLQL